MRKLLASCVVATTLVGCGTEANVNKIWGNDDAAADVKFARAKSAYDHGDFHQAKSLLEDLVARNKDNEEAVVLLGYVYLSTGGIDPFTLAKKLINLTTPTTTDAATKAQLQQLDEGSVAWAQALAGATAVNDDAFLDQAAPSTGTTSTNSNAASTLQKLGTIINLDADDFAKLQKEPYKGKSDLFATAPIIVPKEVSDDLRSSVQVLNYMNNAVLDVCRFVDPTAKVAGDARHASAACAATTVERRNSAKAHFLWAFSHLTEAMVYQSVLLYTTTTTGVSNFEAASATLNEVSAKDTKEIEAFVTKVTDLKGAVDAVFDVANANSMISTTLRNILAVKGAFDALSGLPASMTAPITNALDKIKELAGQLGGKDDVTGQTKALKTQMLETISTKMNKKIGDVVATQVANNLPAGTTVSSKADIVALESNPAVTSDPTKLAKVQDIEKKLYGDTATDPTDKGLCGAYATLSEGLSTSSSSTPDACK
jgi:hypothetical protein